MALDPYPTEEELLEIEEWDPHDVDGLMERLQDNLWWGGPTGIQKNDEGEWEVHTWGWSGNESIIGALQRNFMFWLFNWLESRRGGHYKFKKMEVVNE